MSIDGKSRGPRKTFGQSSKPQARRVSAEYQRSFKSSKGSTQGESRAQGNSREGSHLSDTSRRKFGRPTDGRPESSERFGSRRRPPRDTERPDNVSLFLSAAMLELADELAQEARMPLRSYLTEALRYILLAHGKRLGKSDKYIAEFKSQNRKEIGTWRADKNTPAKEMDSQAVRKSPREQLGLPKLPESENKTETTPKYQGDFRTKRTRSDGDFSRSRGASGKPSSNVKTKYARGAKKPWPSKNRNVEGKLAGKARVRRRES